ncbi:hypothetical protein CRU99_13105 [Malaciobacter mytili]|uniref:hypothetical protein n=1 Tax=Malaciobacter mytili TaxID=603050 RepID=UPI00100BF76E|nr:hypothetical protein [Malaciobacter mytili]RXI36939.1 hypothetical protein CRU99_13105 [Malaciobacter mytili]
MKKILVLCFVFLVNAKAIDLNSILNNLTNNSSIFNESKLSQSIGSCYELKNDFNISDICSLAKFSYSAGVDLCSFTPNITGFKKVSNHKRVGKSVSSLYNYCNDIAKDSKRKLTSVVSLSNIWSSENDMEGDLNFPSGDSKEDFYRGNSPVLDFNKIKESKSESIVSQYFYSKDESHQQTAKYLIDLAKIKRVKDVTKITVSDVGVAKDMIEYEEEVNSLGGTISSDLYLSSPSSISSSLSSNLSTYVDDNGQENANAKANQEANKVKKIIENNARAKKGLYKTLFSSPDDLAIPTQQTLDLYKPSVRPKYAMLIKKQQAREAYINSMIDTEVKLKQDIVDLTTKKAVIMKSNFDAQSVMNEIDKLVD